MGRSAVRILLTLCLVVTAGCRPEPPPDDEGFGIQTSGPTDEELGPERVIEHLRANQIPIGEVEVFTAENDPNTRLGRPGQYTGKANFHDTRFQMVKLTDSEFMNFRHSGGTVEIFATEEDLAARTTALDTALAQIPTAPPEYRYSQGTVLLRLGHVLTPEQAQQYDAALASFQG